MDIFDIAARGLSLQFVTAEARDVDWQSECGDDWHAVLPVPTYRDVENHASDLFADWEGVSDMDAELSDEHSEQFRDHDDFYEWRDTFEPMMNYAWPVSLSYGGPTAEQAAALIEKHGSCCVLIEFSEDKRAELFGCDSDAPEYVIALTGGGMDLSDHIAAAYLACGCVPPERILSGLSNVFYDAREKAKAKRLPLREAYERAADWFEGRAARLRDECVRVHDDWPTRPMLASDIGIEMGEG